MATKQAILVAEAVCVLCPHCLAAQPSPCGSGMWTTDDFKKKHGTVTCVSCDEQIRIEHHRKVTFD